MADYAIVGRKARDIVSNLGDPIIDSSIDFRHLLSRNGLIALEDHGALVGYLLIHVRLGPIFVKHVAESSFMVQKLSIV